MNLRTYLILIMASAMLCGPLAGAQNIIATVPAHDGKMLSMEDVILNRDLAVKAFRDYPFETVAGAKRPQYVPQGEDFKLIPDGGCVYNRGAEIVLHRDGSERVLYTETREGFVSGRSVSRNEFGISGGLFVSADGSKAAFYTKDESRVALFPLLDISGNGSLKHIRYPMAGCVSERVSATVIDLTTGSLTLLDTACFDEEQYLTNLSFSPDGSKVFIMVLDRSQRHMHLNMYDSATGALLKTLLTEDSDTYVEPENPIEFLAGSCDKFIYKSAIRDGYKNLYLCDLSGNITRLTKMAADCEYLCNDGKNVWFAANTPSPCYRQIWKVAIKGGKMTCLTPEEGWHKAVFSTDFKQFADILSTVATPDVTILRRCSDGKILRTLNEAADPYADYAMCEIEFGSIPSADGKFENNYRLYYPKDFNPNYKYPLILYVYGGPHNQMVKGEFLASMRRWEMYMAQRGYLVYVQDNRGTPSHGQAYEKAIHRQCGKVEMEDQVAGIKALIARGFVDETRIGVHGWSYGGFMTISLMCDYPEIFNAGVAGGPVIDWKWYEVMYGERYMSSPQDNAEGYESTSLINKAEKLQGKLLICQGMMDGTVVPQHSMSFVQKCVSIGKQVDYFPYPTAEHNVYGRDRVHLMNKVTDYLITNLNNIMLLQ